MLTVLMALAMITNKLHLETGQACDLPIPLKLDHFRNGLRIEVFVLNLRPSWKIDQITTHSNIAPCSSNESNLEQWRNLVQTIKVEDVAPRQAIPIPKDDGSLGIRRVRGLVNGHHPWYLAINEPCLDRSFKECVLMYDLVKSPTFNSPYYEAFVCCMPNIRCRAKTIEALQEQLLQQYSQYLAKMLQDEVDFPSKQQEIRPGQNGLDGAFIAWLIGATYERGEKKPEITQVYSITTAVDSC